MNLTAKVNKVLREIGDYDYRLGKPKSEIKEEAAALIMTLLIGGATPRFSGSTRKERKRGYSDHINWSFDEKTNLFSKKTYTAFGFPVTYRSGTYDVGAFIYALVNDNLPYIGNLLKRCFRSFLVNHQADDSKEIRYFQALKKLEELRPNTVKKSSLHEAVQSYKENVKTYKEMFTRPLPPPPEQEAAQNNAEIGKIRAAFYEYFKYQNCVDIAFAPNDVIFFRSKNPAVTHDEQKVFVFPFGYDNDESFVKLARDFNVWIAEVVEDCKLGQVMLKLSSEEQEFLKKKLK